MHEENFYISHDALVFIKVKETITCMGQNNYLHLWLLPVNVFQYGTPYSGRPEDNIPKFMHLYHSINRDILHSLCLHCVLSHFVLGWEVTDEEYRIMHISFSTPKEIT